MGKVRDLKGWPIGVWTTSGSGFTEPNRKEARVVAARSRGTAVQLTVRDQAQEFQSALVARTELEASAAARVLTAAKGVDLDTAGELDF